MDELTICVCTVLEGTGTSIGFFLSLMGGWDVESTIILTDIIFFLIILVLSIFVQFLEYTSPNFYTRNLPKFDW